MPEGEQQLGIGAIEKDKIKIDLSNETKGEVYVDKLRGEIAKMDTQTLSEIVKKAGENWVRFDPENFGFKLPTKLTRDGSNMGVLAVEVENAVSPNAAFVGNVAAELWMRRVVEALNVGKRYDWGIDKDNVSEKKIKQLRMIEQMAGVLFSSQVLDRRGLVDKIMQGIIDQEKSDNSGFSIRERSAGVKEMDKGIVEEIILDRGEIDKNQLQNVYVNDERIDLLLKGIRRTLFSSKNALLLDQSIAGARSPQNLSQNENLVNNFVKNLQELSTLDNAFVENN